jgi:protease-4
MNCLRGAWIVGLCLGVTAIGTAQESPKADAPAPKKVTYAHIELRGSFPEGTAAPGLFSEVVETLETAQGRLKKAADDDKIAGVVIHLDGLSVGWAKVHELRASIAKIRAAGKPVYAWMESAMTPDYLVASACSDILLPESGVLMMPGLRAEVTFYKKLFDWLEVQPEMLRVGEYKSAAEPYTRSEMSPQFREELEAVLDGFYSYIVETVAAGRKLPPEKVKEIIDQGVMSAAQAKQLGLIDHVAYEDGIEALVKAKATEPVELKITKGYGKKKVDTDFSGMTGMIKMMNLLMGVEQPQRKSSAPKIAVISAVGAIVSGSSQADFMGESSMGSSTMIKAIRQARDDATVKAIVLRVDSPGGSALASDLMWHELETVKKPFIVSMGDVAASGGYYISMGADRIFAEPGTITGSIGVVGGKFALEKFYAKLGMTTSVVQRGKNSGVMSMTTPFNPTEREAMQKLMNDIYAQFTQKAAAGRKMDVDKLEKLARGRIYTGQQAKELGLVDEVGTLEDAIAFAKQAAGLDPKEKMERLSLPKAANPFEQLFGPLEPETRAGQALLGLLPPSLRAPLKDLHAFELLANEPLLTVMPYRLNVR